MRKFVVGIIVALSLSLAACGGGSYDAKKLSSVERAQNAEIAQMTGCVLQTTNNELVGQFTTADGLTVVIVHESYTYDCPPGVLSTKEKKGNADALHYIVTSKDKKTVTIDGTTV